MNKNKTHIPDRAERPILIAVVDASNSDSRDVHLIHLVFTFPNDGVSIQINYSKPF